MLLTKEEYTIVCHVVNGLKNIEIAEEMGYSEATVKKRLTVIYGKMNVFNKRILCNADIQLFQKSTIIAYKG